MEKLITALFNDFPIFAELRKLLAIPCKLGWTGIEDPTENANDQENNSINKLYQTARASLQFLQKKMKNFKSSMKKKRMERHHNIPNSLREKMSSKDRKLNDIAKEQGSLSWLLVQPIK